MFKHRFRLITNVTLQVTMIFKDLVAYVTSQIITSVLKFQLRATAACKKKQRRTCVQLACYMCATRV